METQRIVDALSMGQRILEKKGNATARLECELLLCHFLHCQRHQLYIDVLPLDDASYNGYLALLQRRLDGEPIQYILGSREFMGLDFSVDKRVLIPRGDTEVLVEFLIDRLRNIAPLRILDLGTGSGAIAVSLAVYLPHAHITAVDVMEAALEAATYNARKHHVEDRIDFVQSNMFATLPIGPTCLYHAIVSNPPYIPHEDIDGLMDEVRRYEPITALDGGCDGLDFYRVIAAQSWRFLYPGGFTAVEMGYGQATGVGKIFYDSQKYKDPCFIKDLANIDRVAVHWVK